MRIIHNRVCGLLLFVVMLLLFLSAHADSSYISIQEMKDNVPSRWTETLKGGKKNFDCTIDAVVVMPETDCFPILRVAYQGETQGLEKEGWFIEENTEKIMMVKPYRMKCCRT